MINVDRVKHEISLLDNREDMFKVKLDESNWKEIQMELLSAGVRWIGGGKDLKEVEWIKGEGGVFKDIVITENTFILVGRGRFNNKMQVWHGNEYFDEFDVPEIVPNKV